MWLLQIRMAISGFLEEKVEKDMKDGLMHLYYGDGKGKTTAAIGLAVRAAGAGKKVLFTQFMKGGKTSELESLEKISGITVLRSEKEFPFYSQMTAEQREEQSQVHNEILDAILTAFQREDFEVLILDEITYPYIWRLMDCRKFRNLLAVIKGKAEIVCTGRNPDSIFLENADYITEMKMVRHPLEKGIAAREGIEY